MGQKSGTCAQSFQTLGNNRSFELEIFSISESRQSQLPRHSAALLLLLNPRLIHEDIVPYTGRNRVANAIGCSFSRIGHFFLLIFAIHPKKLGHVTSMLQQPALPLCDIFAPSPASIPSSAAFLYLDAFRLYKFIENSRLRDYLPRHRKLY